MLQEIIDTLKAIKGTEILYLSEPITVRLSPHMFPLEINALCATAKNELYVMTGESNWNKLEESDVNAEKMISSIYQRVKLIFGNAVNID